MPIEGTTTIDGLNTSWPLTGDGVNEGDDHLRQEKTVLKAMWPGASGNGLATPITATEAELNSLVGVTSAIQAQLDALVASDAGLTPIGGIIMYNGLFVDIPSNYQLCDGTNGTPDMTNRFAYGTNTEGFLNGSGGVSDAIVVTHSHTFTGSALPTHTHTTTASGILAGGNVSPSAVTDAGSRPLSKSMNSVSAGTPTGSISTDGVTGVGANIPPYIFLAYIRRMT